MEHKRFGDLNIIIKFIADNCIVKTPQHFTPAASGAAKAYDLKDIVETFINAVDLCANSNAKATLMLPKTTVDLEDIEQVGDCE